VSIATIIDNVVAELVRQDGKWGKQNHPDGTGDALAASFALRAQQACRDAASRGSCTWQLILAEEVAEAFAESDPGALRAELIQVAAVALQWIEAIDRRDAARKDGP